MTRSEIREQAFILVFEKIFNPEQTVEEMKEISQECELFVLDSFAEKLINTVNDNTEKIVQEGMDKLMEGRTVFVIAHRLSTVRNSKAIIVLDNGSIIERGEHDELIAQKGVYYRLYTGAFELE